MKLWIYGDSFADPNFNPAGWSWPSRLADKYDVTNNAIYGSGPYWSLHKLLDDVESADQNTCLIFVESVTDRLPLSGFDEPGHQVRISKIAEGVNKQKNLSPNQARVIIQQLLTKDWMHKSPLHIFGAVNSIAHHFKKVLYWPLTVKKHTLVKCADNLKLQPIGLRTISDDEIGYGRPLQRPDDRPNHLTQPNHDFVYKTVQQWLKQ